MKKPSLSLRGVSHFFKVPDDEAISTLATSPKEANYLIKASIYCLNCDNNYLIKTSSKQQLRKPASLLKTCGECHSERSKAK